MRPKERLNHNMKKNAFMVISSNLLTLLVSLFMGFVIPKYLSVDDYAYYHIYQLYIAYAGFFHLGLVNGIYLKYGHLDVDELPMNDFRKYSRAMVILQLGMAALLLVVLFLLFPEDRNIGVAYAFTIVNIPLMNIKWFYSSINQFTKRFVIDSAVTYMQNVLQCVMVAAVIIFSLYNYLVLLIAVTLINLICMIAVMIQNKQFVNVFAITKEETKPDRSVGSLIKGGFFFMISEFVAIIILGIDSIFVQNLFTLTDFAMYSFAVSIISVMYTLISTVSNLIYPYLVRVDDDKYAKYYTLMSDVLTFVALMSMLAFYVAKFLVIHWLDKYEASLFIASILFGTVIFRTLIMLVCGNYFKVLKMTKEYTKNNFFSIVLAFVLDFLAYIIFKDCTYIAYASLLAFIIWYVVTDFVFIKRLQIEKKTCFNRYLCIAICLTLFYSLFRVSDIIAFVIYMIVAAVVCIVCFRKHIREIVNGKDTGEKAGK